MKRRTLLVIGTVLGLVLAAALLLPLMIDANRYRPQIEARIEDRLSRQVSLGEIHLSLIPFGFRIHDAVIAEDPRFRTGQSFAQTEILHVQPQLLPLLRGELRIDSLKLTKPKLELIRNKQGTWNFLSIADSQQTNGPAVSIDELQIDDGQVGVSDLYEKKPRVVYDHIDLLLQDYAPGKDFSIVVRAHMSGTGKQTISVRGKAGPIDTDVLTRTPFHGSFEFNEVSISALQHFLNGKALENSDAILTGHAQIENEGGVYMSSGTLKAGTPLVRGVQIGYPITAKYDISGNLNEETVQIRTADLQLGRTPLSLRGNIDARPSPAVLDIQVTSSEASIADAAHLAAALGVAFNQNTKVDGKLSMDVHASGPARKPALTGEISAHDVRISGGGLRQPVQTGTIGLSLSPDAIRSNEFSITTGGTSMTGEFIISKYVSDAPQLHASVTTGNAAINELLNIAHAYGISAFDDVTGSGTALLNIVVTGPLRQEDQLTYSGNGSLQNAVFNLPSISKPIGVQTADLRFNGNSAVFDNLELSLGETVARGNLTVQNPVAPRIDFSLAANQINVREWQSLVRRHEERAPVQEGQPGESRIRRLSGSGQLTVDRVVYDQLQLSNVRSSIRIDDGTVTMNPVTAEKHAGAIVIHAGTHPMTYSVDSNLQNVDANLLLSSVSPLDNVLYGVLSADTDTRFVSETAGTIARSLDGRVSIQLKDGAIANMVLLHQIGAIAQFIRTRKPVEPATKVLQLTGDFDIRDGVARTDNLTATLDGGSFAADGIIDLSRQNLNLHVVAVLSKEYSESVGGTHIGGFMTTALANRDGELVVPILVTGTFQNPRFAPDLQTVAKMKLEQLVPTTDNPADLTIGILERIFRGRQDQEETPEEGPQDEQPAEEQRDADDAEQIEQPEIVPDSM